ncbi:MAG: domain S-box protein [Fibrobacteria bacterium]|nr:domain S-box protein [Fibrobacteria bacterium]
MNHQKNFELFFKLSRDMLCVCNSAGFFVQVNPAFTRILGHSEKYLLSRPFLEFLHPDDREATVRVMARVLAGEATTYFENRYRCVDGEYRWLGWSSSAAAAVDGLFYAVARDITEQKAMASGRDRLARARESLLRKLQDASIKIKTLEGLLPICSYCYQMRDEEGKWASVEDYIEKRTGAEFTHGICPACLETNFPEPVGAGA